MSCSHELRIEGVCLVCSTNEPSPVALAIAHAKRSRLLMRVIGAQCRLSFSEFVKRAWHEVQPGVELRWNWHMQAVCDHVQACYLELARARRDPSYRMSIQNLLINIPPRSAKTLLIQVFGPAWAWTRWPDLTFRCFSSQSTVLKEAAQSCRRLVDSDWYTEHFLRGWRCTRSGKGKPLTMLEAPDYHGVAWTVSGDAITEFGNSAGGHRAALVWGAKVTGLDSIVQLHDDPHDAEEAQSDTKRRTVCRRYKLAIRNRVQDQMRCLRIMVMQRLHEADVSDAFSRQERTDWLKIQQVYDPKAQKPPTRLLGWTDPRTHAGELMHPERFDQLFVDAEKSPDGLGAYGFAGQHQQEPAPADGGLFKRAWWSWYTTDRFEPAPRPDHCNERRARRQPDRFDSVWLTLDANFKETKKGSRACALVLGFKGKDVYILDNYTASVGYTTLMPRLRAMIDEWRPRKILVEEGANGYAVISALQEEFAGVVGVNPLGGKEARAHPTSAVVQSGSVYLPEGAEWVDGFVHELGVFPNGQWDDQVDAFSQGLTDRISTPAVNKLRRMISA